MKIRSGRYDGRDANDDTWCFRVVPTRLRKICSALAGQVSFGDGSATRGSHWSLKISPGEFKRRCKKEFLLGGLEVTPPTTSYDFLVQQEAQSWAVACFSEPRDVPPTFFVGLMHVKQLTRYPLVVVTLVMPSPAARAAGDDRKITVLHYSEVRTWHSKQS